MQLQKIKVVLAAMHVAVVGAAGAALGIASVEGWAVVGCLALLPAIAMLTLWNAPAQTLSEAMREARR